MSKYSHIANDQNDDEHDHKILTVSSALRIPKGLTQEEAWVRLSSKITPKGRLLPFRFPMSLAASIALIIITGLAVYNFQHVVVMTERAEQKIVVLPDSSVVTLNAGSRLSYNSLFWSADRSVRFSGEGYFEIAKGKRFDILSPNGITSILGTRFNLLSRGNVYRVTCISGKVRVSNRSENDAVILNPGFETYLNKDNPAKPYKNSGKVTSWKNGEFYFDASPISEVISTLELQYSIKVDFLPHEQRTYTGYFTNNDLKEALKLICLPLGYQFNIDKDNSVTIYKPEINI